jgi:hypothetical protein
MEAPYVVHDIMKQFATQVSESIETNAEGNYEKEERQEDTGETVHIQPPADVQSTPEYQIQILTNLRKFLSERYSFAPEDETKKP